MNGKTIADWGACYAHSKPGESEPSELWQTLRAHAEGVEGRAARFADAFASKEAAGLIGKVHEVIPEKRHIIVAVRLEDCRAIACGELSLEDSEVIIAA